MQLCKYFRSNRPATMPRHRLGPRFGSPSRTCPRRRLLVSLGLVLTTGVIIPASAASPAFPRVPGASKHTAHASKHQKAKRELGELNRAGRRRTAVSAAELNPVSAVAGQVKSWGFNLYGQLDNGTGEYSPVPETATGLSAVTAIAAGGPQLALLANRTVVAWGSNYDGQPGNGTTTGSSTPVAVSGIGGVTAIAAGDGHGLALLSDGTVRAWGLNTSGELGDGTTTGPQTCTDPEFGPFGSAITPVAVTGLSGVTAIAANGNESLALLSNGTVVAWGQLGSLPTTDSSTPVPVSGLSGVTAIAASGGQNLALLSDGTVRAWGSNGYGQLGDGTTIDSSTPVAVSGLSGVTAITAGGDHGLALLSNGTVMAWGANDLGQLGDGTDVGPETCPDSRYSAYDCATTPVAVSALSGVTAIAASEEDSLALLSDGAVMAWGANYYDQLGLGSSTGPQQCPTSDLYDDNCAPTPVTVSALSGTTAIAAGPWTGFAIEPIESTPPPVITSINPPKGPLGGGTRVQIAGSGFTPTSAVTFGGRAASVSLIDSDLIIAQSPPAKSPGQVNVVVSTSNGRNAASSHDVFTYSGPGLFFPIPVNATVQTIYHAQLGLFLWPLSAGAAPRFTGQIDWGGGSTSDASITRVRGLEGLIFQVAGLVPYSVSGTHTYGAPLLGQGSLHLTLLTSGEPPYDEAVPVTVNPWDPRASFHFNPDSPLGGDLSLVVPTPPFPKQDAISTYTWKFPDYPPGSVVDSAGTDAIYENVFAALIKDPSDSKVLNHAYTLGVLPNGMTDTKTIQQIAGVWQTYFPMHIIPHVFQSSVLSGSQAPVTLTEQFADHTDSSTTRTASVGAVCAPYPGWLPWIGGATTCDTAAGYNSVADVSHYRWYPDFVTADISLGGTSVAGGLFLTMTRDGSVYLGAHLGASASSGPQQSLNLMGGWVGPPDNPKPPPDCVIDNFVNGFTLPVGASVALNVGSVHIGGGVTLVFNPGTSSSGCGTAADGGVEAGITPVGNGPLNQRGSHAGGQFRGPGSRIDEQYPDVSCQVRTFIFWLSFKSSIAAFRSLRLGRWQLADPDRRLYPLSTRGSLTPPSVLELGRSLVNHPFKSD